MVGYNLHFRDKFCTMRSGLECPRSRRQVVVLNINDPQPLLNCPVDCLIDFLNDFLVVFRDVVLQVDYDQRTIIHTISSFVANIAPLYTCSKWDFKICVSLQIRTVILIQNCGSVFLPERTVTTGFF